MSQLTFPSHPLRQVTPIPTHISVGTLRIRAAWLRREGQGRPGGWGGDHTLTRSPRAHNILPTMDSDSASFITPRCAVDATFGLILHTR